MNTALIEHFQTLQDFYKREKDRGRIIAYGNAVAAIRSIPFKITDISQLKGIRGIGPKVTEKIQEFLSCGKIRVVEEKRKKLEDTSHLTEKEKVVLMFQKIWGIGPKKAEKLYDEGITSLKMLKERTSVLTDQQKAGLKYIDSLQQKIPRDVITVIYVIIIYFLNDKYGKNYRIQMAGSYRRKQERSGDIDCLISSSKFSLRDVVKLLVVKGIVVEVLAVRDTKFMGIGHCPTSDFYFRIDIEFVPKEEWGSALLYFTGSKNLNVYMRRIAKRQGYTLSEHGLFNTETGDSVLDNPTEQDIFKKLGIEYIPPEFR